MRVAVLLLATRVVLLPPSAHVLAIVATPHVDVRLDLIGLRGVPRSGARAQAGLAVTAQPVLAALRGVVLVVGLEFSALRAAFHRSIVTRGCDAYALVRGSLYIITLPPSGRMILQTPLHFPRGLRRFRPGDRRARTSTCQRARSARRRW